MLNFCYQHSLTILSKYAILVCSFIGWKVQHNISLSFTDPILVHIYLYFGSSECKSYNNVHGLTNNLLLDLCKKVLSNISKSKCIPVDNSHRANLKIDNYTKKLAIFNNHSRLIKNVSA